MRHVIAACAVVLATACAAPVAAQTDRYGGVGTYRAPPSQGQTRGQAAPARVLTWPGKSTPGAAAQAYAAPTPQAYAPAAYPSAYQPQPYYAPAPRAPTPPPGSNATAPAGVYPPNTVPPHLASPMAIPPQQAQPMVSHPQLPNSIYAPSPQSVGATQPKGPQLAANAAAQPVQGARYYSLHRQFGLEPDRPPAPAPEGPAVELVSSLGSGVGGEPDPENRTRIVSASKTKGGQTAVVRDRGGDEDAN